MKKVAVVTGLGPNDVAIPLLIFETIQAAKDRLEPFGVKFEFEESWGGWRASLDLGPTEDARAEREREREDPFNDEEDEEDEADYPEDLIDVLFDGDYYSGCGECGDLILHEAEFGKSLTGWNLD